MFVDERRMSTERLMEQGEPWYNADRSIHNKCMSFPRRPRMHVLMTRREELSNKEEMPFGNLEPISLGISLLESTTMLILDGQITQMVIYIEGRWLFEPHLMCVRVLCHRRQLMYFSFSLARSFPLSLSLPIFKSVHFIRLFSFEQKKSIDTSIWPASVRNRNQWHASSLLITEHERERARTGQGQGKFF